MPGPYIDSFGDNDFKKYYRKFMDWQGGKQGPNAWASGYGELAPDWSQFKDKPEEQMIMQLIFAALGGAGPRGRYDEKAGTKTAKFDPLKRSQDIIGQ